MGKRHIWVMNADGTGAKQLTFVNLNEDQPAWSPDGSKIAFHREDGLIVINAVGKPVSVRLKGHDHFIKP